MRKNPLYEEHLLFPLVAEGNREAYTQLFEIYFPYLYEAALAYIKIPVLAEDVVQGVFLKVWEKRTKLATLEKPKDWLFILARNEILNIFRKQAVHRGYVDHIKEIFNQEANSPEELLILRQKDDILKRAVNQLSPQQKKAYLLSREEGLTYEEIGKVMSISKNTVREHISLALKTIRAFLMKRENQLSLLLSSGTILYYYFFY